MFNIQGLRQQINNININNRAQESLETTLRMLQSGTVSGREEVVVHWELIVVSLALYSRCVSPSHCALLASGSAEEAPHHAEAVHHHQSLCNCECVCLMRPHKLLSNKQTLLQQQSQLKFPRCFQINQEHCQLPLWVCISDDAHSLHPKFTPQNIWKKQQLPLIKINITDITLLKFYCGCM